MRIFKFLIAVGLLKIYLKYFRAHGNHQNSKIVHNHDFISSKQKLFPEKNKNFYDITSLWREKDSKIEKKQKGRVKSLSKCDDKLNLDQKETKNVHSVKKKFNVNAPPFVKILIIFFFFLNVFKFAGQDKLTEKEKIELQSLLSFVLQNNRKRSKSQNSNRKFEKGNYHFFSKPQENTKLKEFLLK